MVRDDLGNRMKEYESRNRYYLQRRTPVICRLDMRAGHSFTKGFKRPLDEVFIKSMQETAKYLCENVQGCKMSYQQSDEITLLLVDYDRLDTDCFFNYRVDKLCSILASMATMVFNKCFEKKFYETIWSNEDELNSRYMDAIIKGAMFDCRCFNIPKEEVTNCFYWRQLDASRNSIQMVGQANFSHRELQEKSSNDIQDMLMLKKGINWNDFPTYQKRGSCCIRNKIVVESNGIMETTQLRDASKSENEWIVDKNIPIFKGDGREYIE